MKHIKLLSHRPQAGQTDDTGLAAIFSLISDLLTVFAVAVTAKENSSLPDLSGLLGGGDGT